MGDKMNNEYFEPGAAAFNYNNVTGGADSASGGSGGSGMECLPLRSPGQFHYLISEQAKSLVALQELQNEVGALLEFRDLVIETFPNLRSKMAPSTPAGGARSDWEPGVRVRRKLPAADSARAKPQPSVQDSGFSTETSCGKDAHSAPSASSSAPRRPLEDELWALLDVIQRKGARLRDEAELLRAELDEPAATGQSFAAALEGACGGACEAPRLRAERDALLARAAQLEAAAATPPTPHSIPLGRLDAALDTPSRLPRVLSPDSTKFAAILLESNPVELQRQLLSSTVQNQVLCDRLRRAAAQRTLALERLGRVKDVNEDLKFRLEEKSIELEGARALVRQLEGARADGRDSLGRSREGLDSLGRRAEAQDSLERRAEAHDCRERRGDARDSVERRGSMRDMEPLHIPSAPVSDADEERISETPRRSRPSRIPLHTAHKGTAPRPPTRSPAPSARSPAPSARSPAPSARSPAPPRPPSQRSTRSSTSGRSRGGRTETSPAKSGVPVRRTPAPDAKRATWSGSWALEEYVARAGRLASPSLAVELALWADRPQHYFDTMNYARDDDDAQFDADSLA